MRTKIRDLRPDDMIVSGDDTVTVYGVYSDGSFDGLVWIDSDHPEWIGYINQNRIVTIANED